MIIELKRFDCFHVGGGFFSDSFNKELGKIGKDFKDLGAVFVGLGLLGCPSCKFVGSGLKIIGKSICLFTTKC